MDEMRIDYTETGDGPPILFVPGSFSTPAAWRSIQSHLPPARFVATSLCGYGATPETRTLEDPGLDHQTRVLSAAAKRIGEPVHVVGHSYGATCALKAILDGAIDALSVTTFEANPLPLIKVRGRDDLFQKTNEMSRAFEKAHFDGERDAAARIIDFWGGNGIFDTLPASVQAYCRSTTMANVLDWRSVEDFEKGVDDVGKLECPSLIVRGQFANAQMVEITEVLTDRLPNARSAVVEGAGHFLISTHPRQCAGLLCDFIRNIDRRITG